MVRKQLSSLALETSDMTSRQAPEKQRNLVFMARDSVRLRHERKQKLLTRCQRNRRGSSWKYSAKPSIFTVAEMGGNPQVFVNE